MNTLISALFLFTICFTAYAHEIDYAALEKEFTADTTRVEQAYRNSTDYSTAGMIQALYSYEEAYDSLLNKYYKILLNSLEEDDKEVLKVSQRNWIKLRDSEKDLINALHAKAYKEAGGGTMWGIVAAQARLDVTRRRVFEIYDYLMFGDVGDR